MSFNDFVKKFDLKNKATSNIKIQKVLTSIGLDNVKIYLRDGPFSSISESSIYIRQKVLIGFVI